MTDIQQSVDATGQKKVLVETWGCQMNVADSERMLALLAERDYVLTDQEDDADLVLLNTCHIREKARHKVLSRLGRLRQLKVKRPAMKIAVAGCVAQADGQRLLDEAPQIDLLFGPGKIDELPQLLDQQADTGEAAMAIGFSKSKEREQAALVTEAPAARTGTIPTVTGKNEISRYVNIQHGCNNFCTFCVVPFTRGREISRRPEEIEKEVRNLLAQGAREVTVLGQNVNSYGLDLVDQGSLAETERGPFADLLYRLAAIDELDRLRFTTSNPHDFSEPLAQAFADLPKLGRYLHLPVQSGDDEMLQAMKRKVTVAEFHQRVEWLRRAVPDMALSTDLIVGFPGETEEQFENTVKLVQDVEFSFIFSFMYSPRRGTAAARFRNQVDQEVKQRRLQKLNAVQDAITIAQNEAEIGQERPVLFLYESKKEAGVFYGRTEHYRLVRVRAGHDIVGRTLPVKIQTANKTALAGDLL